MSFKFVEPTDSNTAKIKMENCIREIRNWMLVNKLKLNDDKTEFLILYSRYAKADVSIKLLTVGREIVNSTKAAKNVGVLFDSTMSMEDHINAVCKTAHFHLYNLSRIRRYLTYDACATVVHALVTSRLDYCNSLLYGLSGKLLGRLQKVQNCAARLVALSRRRDHITPILKQLHWLPVNSRIKFKILLLTYKALHDQAPSYLTQLLHPYQPSRSLRSSHMDLLVVPESHYKCYGARSFACVAPVLWNDLPPSIRKAPSVTVFKRMLKTHLFLQCFN